MRHRPLPIALSALLFQHLAAMEKAGLPADSAYALLDLGAGASERVAAFRRLAKRGIAPPAAGVASGLFSAFDTRLLRAAFDAGSPLPTYQRLAMHYAARSQQRMQIKSRMMLPLVIMALALCVAPLPAIIGGKLSGAGYLLRTFGPMALLALVLLAYRRLHNWLASGADDPGRGALDRALLALPLFGPMHLRRNARDFVESLALMLNAGLSLFEALPGALDTVGNGLVRADLASIVPTVQAGAPLSQALSGLRVVPSQELFAFVHTGEESGTLAEMLGRYAAKETAAINLFQMEAVAWGPRLFYALVAMWMAMQILSSPQG